MSRPREIEQWSNAALIHPLSRRLAAAFIKIGISANTVSLLGLSCMIGAALLFAYGSWPSGSIVGVALLFISHVFDGADGTIARVTGTSSQLGEIIDGLCDYLGWGTLYVALFVFSENDMGVMESAILVSLAVISHIIQANFYESRRRQYCFRVYGSPWIGSSRNRADVEHRPSRIPLPFRYPVVVFLAISDLLSRETEEMEYVGAKYLQCPNNSKYKEVAAENIKKLSILGQNAKTFLFGAAMIFDLGIIYFITVICFLNIFLIKFKIYENRKWKTIYWESPNTRDLKG